MGTRSYSVFEYGVLFWREDLDMAKVRREFAEYLEENMTDEDFNMCEHFTGDIDCGYYDIEFNGEAKRLKDNESVELPHPFILGWLCKFPSFYQAQYLDYDDLKQDVKKKFEIYLKDDFPWDERIVELMGTTWG
jgi:hypothetical protein